MGDDEGDQSRRKAAFGETTPDDPEEPTTPMIAPRTLLLTMVKQISAASGNVLASGTVQQESISSAQLVPGGHPGSTCSPTWRPVTTCKWVYERTACPALHPNCPIGVRLRASPNQGARVVWTGCTSYDQSGTCYRSWPTGQADVTAKFEIESAPPSKANALSLALTVVGDPLTTGFWAPASNTAPGFVSGCVRDGLRIYPPEPPPVAGPAEPVWGPHCDGSIDALVLYGYGSWTPLACYAAAGEGRTCLWDYEKRCVSDPGCGVVVKLNASVSKGTLVTWTGCSIDQSEPWPGYKSCLVRLLPGRVDVKATFVADPKALKP